ncbi:MAG: hypothetical protein AAF990_23285 [Bacteroidota bacterium]
MADGIQNAGRKGYCLLYSFIGFFMLIALILYVYWYNFDLTY